MSNIKIYFHDPVEVDPSTSWTGLSRILMEADRCNIANCELPKIKALFLYARPDAVITVDDEPVLSIEQTMMNPSGHNIPQRFSFHVKAAELGVPSILYYPEYSKRTFSDPNLRYAQIRVPLAQKRLTRIYNIPALSIFWPTDPNTNLPELNRNAHMEMAEVVTEIVENYNDKDRLLELPSVVKALRKMDWVISKYSKTYASRNKNTSVRDYFPNGLDSAAVTSELSIDPPITAQLIDTNLIVQQISELHNYYTELEKVVDFLSRRKYSFVFVGTANAGKTDSEHPWPGYLSLLDVLYVREDLGRFPTQRKFNLIFRLPVSVRTYLSRIQATRQPTATHIVDSFADLIILNGGIIPGNTIRQTKGVGKIAIT